MTAYCQSPTKHKCRLSEDGLSRLRISSIAWPEISQGDLQTIRRSLVPEVAPFQVGLISFRVNNLYVLESSLFLRSQIDSDLICDGTRHFFWRVNVLRRSPS